MEQQLLALVQLNSVVVMVQMVDRQVEVQAHLPGTASAGENSSGPNGGAAPAGGGEGGDGGNK